MSDSSFLHFRSKHVKISKMGMKVLKNSELKNELVSEIMGKKKELDKGESVTIGTDGQQVTVRLAGSFDNSNKKE
jgi:hypothetical protein